MTIMTPVVNAVQRTLGNMFPGYFDGTKHNHYADYGWPDTLNFEQYYAMYCRSGLANAGVTQTALKTWQDNPAIWESEKAKESVVESDIRQWLDDLRFWQRAAEADKRAMVGGYAGLILRLADDKMFREPVDTVSGGLEGLVEVIPAWAGQLTVSEWDSDEKSATYGHPVMFQFNEAAVPGATSKPRAFQVHPDRVIIWSEDGTVHARSALEPGYNDLLDLQKISGAGGEGFWKNAKRGLTFEVDPKVEAHAMAQGMGVQQVEDVADKVAEVAGDFNKGFDDSIMLQGIKVGTVGVSMPSPEHFHAISLMGFAASLAIPVKILVGSQTGERASTEDASAWAQTNMSRRTNIVIPVLREFIKRMEMFNIMAERDWHIEWSDLTESSMAERVERANKMADTNSKTPDEPTYTVGEIRMVTGHEGEGPDPLGDDEI